MAKPLCFVLMPFGKKKGPKKLEIDFDYIYKKVIHPAIVAAKMEPIRADEESVGGIIHKPMFERLVMCQYAVADMTFANANVFYELGVRHGTRPWSTVAMFEESTPLPFDVNYLRALPYKLNKKGSITKLQNTVDALTKILKDSKKQKTDSPVFQLIDDMPVPELDHSKTDIFREQVRYAEDSKNKLQEARESGLAAIDDVANGFGKISDIEAGVLIDLFLSYRAVEAWDKMIDLVDKMPTPIAQSVLVREQLGFAWNRAGKSTKAETVLKSLINERGANSETNGILGRIYKDRWQAAKDSKKAVDQAKAPGLLKKAIDTYLAGFEADWRDAYPGINAVTLMEISDPPDDRRHELLPVVRYSVERKMAAKVPDYWDYATMLELAILENDKDGAEAALNDSLANMTESWCAATTLNNLNIIAGARKKRKEKQPAWFNKIQKILAEAANQG
jgi:hypothetical protein